MAAGAILTPAHRIEGTGPVALLVVALMPAVPVAGTVMRSVVTVGMVAAVRRGMPVPLAVALSVPMLAGGVVAIALMAAAPRRVMRQGAAAREGERQAECDKA